MSKRLAAVLEYSDRVDPGRIPDSAYIARLWKQYGLSWEEYDALYEAQRGVCAICKQPDPNWRLCVDHCHATGRVRGLLCHPCNTALGLFQDDTERLAKAIEYIAHKP